MRRLVPPLTFLLLLAVLLPARLEAQGGPPRLSGPEKRQLSAIAREPIAAVLEDRAPRQPTVGQRLLAQQPVCVSMYLDGKLVARSWELEMPGPLSVQVSALAASLLTGPGYGAAPDLTDLARVKIGVSVFYRPFRQIKDDSELEEGHGVVVLNGFRVGVAVPLDVAPGSKPADLLSFASGVGGMRPGGWLLPESSLLSAVVDDEREK
jgi:hypothetical protein